MRPDGFKNSNYGKRLEGSGIQSHGQEINMINGN